MKILPRVVLLVALAMSAGCTAITDEIVNSNLTYEKCTNADKLRYQALVKVQSCANNGIFTAFVEPLVTRCLVMDKAVAELKKECQERFGVVPAGL